MAEGKGEIAGRDSDSFAVGKIVVEIATEIMIFGGISSGCTHVSYLVYVCKRWSHYSISETGESMLVEAWSMILER